MRTMRWRVLFSILLFALSLYTVGEWVFSDFFWIYSEVTEGIFYNVVRVSEIAALFCGGIAVLANRRGWMLAVGVLTLSWGLPIFVIDCLPYVFSVNMWMLMPGTMLGECLRVLGMLLGVCLAFTCFGAVRRGQRLHKAQWVLCFVFLGTMLCSYWYGIGLRFISQYLYYDGAALLTDLLTHIMYCVVQMALFSILPFYLLINAAQLSPDRSVWWLPEYTLYRGITLALFLLGLVAHYLFLEWDAWDLWMFSERQLLVSLLDCALIAGYLFLLIEGSFKVHQTYLYRGSHGVAARCIYWIGSLVGLLFVTWLLTVLYPTDSDSISSISSFSFACGGLLCWILVEINRAYVQHRPPARVEAAGLQQEPVQDGDTVQYAPAPADHGPAAATPAPMPQEAAAVSSDQSLFTRPSAESSEGLAAASEWGQQKGEDASPPPAEETEDSLFREKPPTPVSTAAQPQPSAPPPAETPRFCRYCGAGLPADSRYCPACGRQIKTDENL